MRALTVAAFIVVLIGFSATWSLGSMVEPFGAQVTGVALDPEEKTWEYALTNTSSSPDYTIWLLQIEVDSATAAVNVVSPTGWSASFDPQAPNLVTWMDNYGSLPAGDTQGGFRITFQSRPVTQGWTVMFDNAAVPGDTPVSYGEVTIPEAGSALVMAAGLAGLAGAVGRRRRR